ncbi:ankyrin repeat domain-containing protein 35 [Discoglossus pictus]
MKKIFSCSTSQVPVEKWNKHDQKLLEAVEKGDAKKVSSILSKRPIRPTKPGPNGQSAFHLAASRGLTDCLNVIISQKVEVNAKTDNGCTALHLAASKCHPDCVRLLLQRGAHEDSIDFHSRTPLHCAAAAGCVSSTLLLCDAEDTILDAADDDGRTPLMVAAQCNHPTVCSLLLDRGAQVNVTDRDKKTALILACEKSNIQAAETLLCKGAKPEPRDTRGCDALHYAQDCRDDALKRLIQAALDRRKSDHDPECDTLTPCKKQTRGSNREQELVSIWKKRYDEEQKRGLWLQGEVMTKTHELEIIYEEKSRIRELVEKLKDLLKNQREGQESKRNGEHKPEIGDLLNQLVEQVKVIKEQRQKESMPLAEKMKTMSNSTTEPQEMQEKRQDEVRCLQEELVVVREKEECAMRRVVELEGHLENMRNVLSQFEKRKRIQSSVVEDLQEQISQVTHEKEELLTLVKELKSQEKTFDDTKFGEPYMLQDNIRVLKEFLKEMKSECVDVEKDTEDHTAGKEASKLYYSFVPVGVLEKSGDSWKKTIAAMEQCLVMIERSQQVNMSPSPNTEVFVESGPLMSGAADEGGAKSNKVPHILVQSHTCLPKVEANVPCFQDERSPCETGVTCMESKVSQALNASYTHQEEEPIREFVEINSLRQKISELEIQLSTLKRTHEDLCTQMTHTSQEKQNLEEGLLALQDSLQSEFVQRQEMEIHCRDLKRQVLLLSDELSAEQDKLKKLNGRLDAQHREMLVLRDSFPPEIIQEENIKPVNKFQSDILEELYWNVGTLVRKYNEAIQQKVTLQNENQKMVENQAQAVPLIDHNNILNSMSSKVDSQVRESEELKQRLFQVMANSISRNDHEDQMAGLERVVTTLREENEAYKVALEKKCEEAIVLKQQLEQEAEDGQVVRSREANEVQEYERVRYSLEMEVQTLSEEVRILSDKYKEASEEAACCKETMAAEKSKVVHLEGRIKELEREAEEPRLQAQKCQEENRQLLEKCEHFCRSSQEKEVKMEGSVKALTRRIEEQQRKYEEAVLELEDTNKRHQDVIAIYRTHLLSAAQGLMDEDVHFTLHWILKMKKDLVY